MTRAMAAPACYLVAAASTAGVDASAVALADGRAIPA